MVIMWWLAELTHLWPYWFRQPQSKHWRGSCHYLFHLRVASVFTAGRWTQSTTVSVDGNLTAGSTRRPRSHHVIRPGGTSPAGSLTRSKCAGCLMDSSECSQRNSRCPTWQATQWTKTPTTNTIVREFSHWYSWVRNVTRQLSKHCNSCYLPLLLKGTSVITAAAAGVSATEQLLLLMLKSNTDRLV